MPQRGTRAHASGDVSYIWVITGFPLKSTVLVDFDPATRISNLRGAGGSMRDPGGTPAGESSPTARTMIRTVAGLTDDTTISTGLPAIEMLWPSPRMMPPDT